MEATLEKMLKDVSAKDLANALSTRKFPKTKVKMLADQVAKMEASGDYKLHGYIINGIPPFDDIFTAHIRTPRDKLDWIIKHFINVDRLGASIIINGIPAEKLLDVHIAVPGR